MARPATHPRSWRRRAWCGALVVLAAAAMMVASPAGLSPALAQMLTFPPRPKPPVKPERPQEQMLVRAEEINYDYSNERVSAVGNVQLYFGNSTLEADRVIYDQKTKRLHAEGNVTLTQGDGTGATTIATVSSIRSDSMRRSRPASPPSARRNRAISRSFITASIPPASRAGTIRRNPRNGR
jgi:LPS-assembly protein